MNDKSFLLTVEKLGEIFDIPVAGYNVYAKFTLPMVDKIEHLALVKKYAQKPNLTAVRKVITKELSDIHRLIHIFAIKCFIPRGSRKTEATALDMILMELLMEKKPINLHVLVIKHICGFS